MKAGREIHQFQSPRRLSSTRRNKENETGCVYLTSTSSSTSMARTFLNVEKGPFTMPGGLVINGQVYNDAYLRPLTGWEEELIAENTNLTNAQLTSLILSHCLMRLGPMVNQGFYGHSEDGNKISTTNNTSINIGSASYIQDLLVGDRDYLLLSFARLHLVIALQGH